MQIFATAFAVLLLLYNTLKAPIKYFIICSAFRRSTGIMLFWGGFFSFVCWCFFFYSSVLHHIWVDRCGTWMTVSLDPPPPAFSLKFNIACQWMPKQHKEDILSYPPPQKKKESDNDFQLFYSEKKVSL